MLSRLLGLALRDVLLTGEEYRAMAAGLADTGGPATAPTALSGWLGEHSSGWGCTMRTNCTATFGPAHRRRPFGLRLTSAALLLASRGGRDRVEGAGRASG